MRANAYGWTAMEMTTSLILSLREEPLDIFHSIFDQKQPSYENALEMRYVHNNL